MKLNNQPKNRNCGSGLAMRGVAVWRKIMPIILFLCVMQLSVAARAQKITLHIKNASFKSALEAIKAQSGYDLVLVQSYLEGTRPVSADLVNGTVQQAMELVTKGQPVSFEIRQNVIILQRREAAQTLAPAPARQPVTGQVRDAKGELLPGVTIQVKGTNKGTRTDASGNYKLDADKGDVLVVSSIGFETREIVFDGAPTLNITLQVSQSALNEVVVVGYGTQQRKNVTGSVASVKMSEVNTATSTNFTQALAGRAAGVNVVQTTGQPGAGVSVQIRSNASFASEGPLYVVDGVIVNDNAGEPETNTRYGGSGVNRSPLNFLNPNDIETIDILKDASATAIYGARAAGGVVLITTKKGKSGSPSLQYDVSHAFQQSLPYYDILGTRDYMEQRNKILREKWMLDNKIAPYGNVDPSTVTPFVPKYTAQQIAEQAEQPSAIDAIMRKGFTQQHNISMSGTANKTRYYVSGNYLDQEGVLKHSDYRRYSGKLSLEQGIGEKVKAGVNVIATGSQAENGSIGAGVYENSGMIGAAFYHPPTIPFQDEQGNYPINPDYQNTPNPLSFLTITDNTKASRLLTSGFAEWIILPGLTARGSLAYDQSITKRSTYFPRTFLYGARAEGQAGIFESNATSKLTEYTLSYVKDLPGNSRLNAVAGHSYQLTDKDGLTAGNDHFPTDNFLYYNIGLGTALRPTVGSYRNSTRVWKSYFARAIYELKGKYIFTASVRRDGASHFAKNKKWGTFPGVSAAWILSEENFLQAVPAISFLKLRTGYGAVGNSNIGSSAFTYFANNSPYVIGGVNLPGVRLAQIANPNLTWETQTELNAGLDFGFLKDRISGSFDYFSRRFTNLLSNVPLPTDFPVSSFASNAGTTKSTGWEISLQTKNILQPNGLSWNTTLNFSHYKNQWVERSAASLKSLAKYVDPKGNFNAQYGYLSDGIYNPASGMKAPDWMPGILPGEIIIKDLNGYDGNGNLTGKPDGQLSTADMVQLHTNNDPTGNGRPVPNFSFGMNNQFTYGNFDLSIYMYGLIQKKFNSDLSNTTDVYAKLGAFGWNVLSVSKDRWAYDNTNGTMPTGLNTAYGGYASSSDFWVEDASFLRCRDITLGYRLPAGLLQRQNTVKTARVFVNVQNPFIITGYKGIDPELQNFYAYPMTKSFTIGASIGF